MKLRDRAARQSGSSLVLLTLMLPLVLFPIVGLAIDGTIMYLVRAKVSQACDAAALAGARSLSTGLDINSQAASAKATAQQYFAANFPNNFMGITYLTDGSFPAVTVTQNANASRTVSVQASVTAPTYFIRFLGTSFNSSIVGTSAQATRRDVNLMLVLDRSNSMQMAGVCPTMVANSQTFVNYFSDGRDQLGLITFMAGSNVDYKPSLTFKSAATPLSTVLGTLVCNGDTGSAQALTQAYQQILALNQPGRLNVIVFFTDGNPNGVTVGKIAGQPNAVSAPIKTLADTRYDPLSYNSLVTIPPSNCLKTAVLGGAIAQEIGNPTATVGYTSGLYSPIAPNISVGPDVLMPVPGCASSSNTQYPQIYIRNDLAYIPSADSYGNVTNNAPIDPTMDLFTSGPYAGKIRPDVPQTIVRASTSAAYSAGATIHADPKFNIRVYTIGLGGTAVHDPVNSAFLATLANDPNAVQTYGGSYNPKYPNGLYVYSPTVSQLAAAYSSIASQILRLSQ